MIHGGGEQNKARRGEALRVGAGQARWGGWVARGWVGWGGLEWGWAGSGWVGLCGARAWPAGRGVCAAAAAVTIAPC